MNWLQILFHIGQIFYSLAIVSYIITKAVIYTVVKKNKNTIRFNEITNIIQEINIFVFLIGFVLSLSVVFRIISYILE